MVKRTILTERLRRVSTSDVFRSSKAAEPSLEPLAETPIRPIPNRSKSVPDTLLSSSTTTNLLTLPTEICANILAYTTFEDLCAFRLACRTTHHLLRSGDIIRQWINSHVDPHQLFLHPAHSPSTFIYALEQRRRFLTITRTSHVLVEYIEHEILRHTLRRANIYTDQYRQVQEKAQSMQSFLTTSLSPPHLLLSHRCFLFLSWLSNQLLSRPSYAGSVERTMRGWLSEPLDYSSFLLFLLFGNLGALARLIELPSYKYRRKAVEAWMRGLDPGQDVRCWRERWGELGGELDCGRVLERERVSGVLGCRMGVESVWFADVRPVLVGKGLLRDGEEAGIGSPWQTMDFLCDIAGYDILHTPPSWETASERSSR